MGTPGEGQTGGAEEGTLFAFRVNRVLLKLRYFNETQEHGLSDADVHNAGQRLTWDASADAKGFRATAPLSGSGSKSGAPQALEAALSFAAEPVFLRGGFIIINLH